MKKMGGKRPMKGAPKMLNKKFPRGMKRGGRKSGRY